MKTQADCLKGQGRSLDSIRPTGRRGQAINNSVAPDDRWAVS